MEDFYKLFRIPTFAMNVNRSNPYIDKNKTWCIQFITFFVLFTLDFVIIIYNIVYYDLKIKDFSQTCKNGVLSVVYVVVTYQYCILLYHRHGIIELIEDIKKDYELSIDFPLEEQQVMSDYSKKGIWVCKQCLMISCCCSLVFVLKNLILFAYYYFIGEARLVYFYELSYPDVIERNKDTIIVFCLIDALLLLFAFSSTVMYIAFVPLGPMFMIHASGQLELVKMRMSNVFDEHDDEIIRIKIKSVIYQLQYIYRFVDRINACFKVTYELTLKATTIMLPITCYELIESFKRGEISLEFLTFIFGGTLLSSSPCFYSDMLMEKGEDVRLAVYICGWERHHDLRTRSTLQLILLRALRPIAIRTMFRTMCLDALTDLFQQSYTIFNLMNAMWNEN